MRRILCVFALLAGACDNRQGAPIQPNRPIAKNDGAPVAPVRFRPELGVGVVRGIVAFEGETPMRARIQMKQECEQLLPANEPSLDERIIVDEHPDGSKTLRNVFVHVSAGLQGWTFDVPADRIRIRLHRCRYDLHVIGARVGQSVEFVAQDPVAHNPHYLPVRSRDFGFSQGDTMVTRFSRPEILANFKCDVHSWMKMYVGVVEHPFFAVTGSDGTFTLPALPPGKYTLTAVHETGAKRAVQLTVAPSAAPVPVRFVFDRASIR